MFELFFCLIVCFVMQIQNVKSEIERTKGRRWIGLIRTPCDSFECTALGCFLQSFPFLAVSCGGSAGSTAASFQSSAVLTSIYQLPVVLSDQTGSIVCAGTFFRSPGRISFRGRPLVCQKLRFLSDLSFFPHLFCIHHICFGLDEARLEVVTFSAEVQAN